LDDFTGSTVANYCFHGIKTCHSQASGLLHVIFTQVQTTETSPQHDNYVMTRTQAAGYLQNRYEGIAAHKRICNPVSRFQ
jgi:hypothetical protein